ncbi:hypothetical protein ACH436_12470 [Isoptericola sp. NPDC019693]|uniref:hypothetical protein n=1 Tax=Isoptericola sp. NPDC019693 TaxID=3364009 RepID=UPI003798CBEB
MSETYEIKAVSHGYKRAALATDVSETLIREAVSRGDLAVHYVNSKPVILHAELEAWIESLPSERR